MSVPPLALLGLGLSAAGATSGLALLSGALLPAGVLAGQTVAAATAVGAAWFSVGRDILPPRMLLGVPVYVLWKLPVYLKFARSGKETHWVRTERAVP